MQLAVGVAKCRWRLGWFGCHALIDRRDRFGSRGTGGAAGFARFACRHSPRGTQVNRLIGNILAAPPCRIRRMDAPDADRVLLRQAFVLRKTLSANLYLDRTRTPGPGCAGAGA